MLDRLSIVETKTDAKASGEVVAGALEKLQAVEEELTTKAFLNEMQTL